MGPNKINSGGVIIFNNYVAIFSPGHLPANSLVNFSWYSIPNESILYVSRELCGEMVSSSK